MHPTTWRAPLRARPAPAGARRLCTVEGRMRCVHGRGKVIRRFVRHSTSLAAAPWVACFEKRACVYDLDVELAGAHACAHEIAHSSQGSTRCLRSHQLLVLLFTCCPRLAKKSPSDPQSVGERTTRAKPSAESAGEARQGAVGQRGHKDRDTGKKVRQRQEHRGIERRRALQVLEQCLRWWSRWWSTQNAAALVQAKPAHQSSMQL